MRISICAVVSVLFILMAFLFIGCSEDEEEAAENGELPGGGLPGDIPDGTGGNQQPGDQPQDGGDDIVVTIGDGARPMVSVSHPVKMLTIISHQDGKKWGFLVMGEGAPGIPGPFQYGVTPPGTLALGGANPADLVPGQKYAVSATVTINGQPAMTMFDFIR